MDVVTAYQAGFGDGSDPDLLAWAAEQTRVVVTHDRRTMPSHAAARIAGGESVAGIIVVSWRLSVSQVINDLEVIVSCSDVDEWENVIKNLPL